MQRAINSMQKRGFSTSFGVTIKERTFAAQNIRYQFNGKEYDSETETSDFGARNLDGDLGVWGARDAYWKKYPDYSPYNFALNNPIIFIDSDGDDVSLFLNKTSSAALKRFVSTDIGRAFIAHLSLV